MHFHAKDNPNFINEFEIIDISIIETKLFYEWLIYKMTTRIVKMKMAINNCNKHKSQASCN